MQFFPGTIFGAKSEDGEVEFGIEEAGEDDMIDLTDGDWSGYDE